MICPSPRAELAALVERLRDRPLVHADHGRAFLTDHVPWWVEVEGGGCAGQRAFLRSVATIRVIVAGRQSGKTHCVAEEVVRICLARPGTDSCLLMPTTKSTKGALKHLRRALEPVASLVHWAEVDKCFSFANGAKLYVRTSDKEAQDGVPTRGLTIDGVLWVDEASFVPESAWDAAQATMAAVQDPKVIVTTTPMGRNNWVFKLCASAEEDEDTEWFRFRTTDSPYHSPKFVAKLRKRYGAKRAQEELDAVFLGETDIPFPPELVARAFDNTGLPIRGKQLSLGVDLGKRSDYTVLTLANEFGEFWVLDRFREARGEGDDRRFWVRATKRIVQLAREHDAIVVLDESGGMGSTMVSFVSEELGESRVHGIKTGNWRLKAELIEALISDFENGRATVSNSGQHAEDARHELTFFPAPERKVLNGTPVLRYVGAPEADAEDDDALHDDIVVSICLARWGAVHAWEEPRKRSDLGSFPTGVSAARSNLGGQQSGGGYRFRLPGR